MIRLTLEFTDNLGPEADLASLLKRFDNHLRGLAIQGAHVLVDARVLVDYVAEIGDGAWATLILTLSAPASLAAAVAPCREVLLSMAEAHLAEMFLRHSIVISSRLVFYADDTLAERRRQRAPGPGF
jgi:hypothetical protein